MFGEFKGVYLRQGLNELDESYRQYSGRGAIERAELLEGLTPIQFGKARKMLEDFK